MALEDLFGHLPELKEEEIVSILKHKGHLRAFELAEIGKSRTDGNQRHLYYVVGKESTESNMTIYVSKRLETKRDLRVKGKYKEIERINCKDIERLKPYDIRYYHSLTRK